MEVKKEQNISPKIVKFRNGLKDHLQKKETDSEYRRDSNKYRKVIKEKFHFWNDAEE